MSKKVGGPDGVQNNPLRRISWLSKKKKPAKINTVFSDNNSGKVMLEGAERNVPKPKKTVGFSNLKNLKPFKFVKNIGNKFLTRSVIRNLGPVGFVAASVAAIAWMLNDANKPHGTKNNVYKDPNALPPSGAEEDTTYIDARTPQKALSKSDSTIAAFNAKGWPVEVTSKLVKSEGGLIDNWEEKGEELYKEYQDAKKAKNDSLFKEQNKTITQHTMEPDSPKYIKPKDVVVPQRLLIENSVPVDGDSLQTVVPEERIKELQDSISKAVNDSLKADYERKNSPEPKYSTWTDKKLGLKQETKSSAKKDSSSVKTDSVSTKQEKKTETKQVQKADTAKQAPVKTTQQQAAVKETQKTTPQKTTSNVHYISHTVKQNENIWKIAREVLKESNGGKRPKNSEVQKLVNIILEERKPKDDVIKSGEKILIPQLDMAS